MPLASKHHQGLNGKLPLSLMMRVCVKPSMLRAWFWMMMEPRNSKRKNFLLEILSWWFFHYFRNYKLPDWVGIGVVSISVSYQNKQKLGQTKLFPPVFWMPVHGISMNLHIYCHVISGKWHSTTKNLGALIVIPQPTL